MFAFSYLRFAITLCLCISVYAYLVSEMAFYHINHKYMEDLKSSSMDMYKTNIFFL